MHDFHYTIAEGLTGAKKAYVNALEIESAWETHKKFPSDLLATKRYKIVNTQPFKTKEAALAYITKNKPFKMRTHSAGCVLIQKEEEEEVSYLFFTQSLKKETIL